MKLKETKQITLFKFINEKSQQVNIYVEPTEPGEGRFIISTMQCIFQRYFDGCNPDIFQFLSKQTLESICGCFVITNDFSESDQYEYLLKRLSSVWPLFIEAVKEGMQEPAKPEESGIIQLTIKIEHVEGHNYHSSTTFPQSAKAILCCNQLRACADGLEQKILEKAKTMDMPSDTDDALAIVKELTIQELL